MESCGKTLPITQRISSSIINKYSNQNTGFPREIRCFSIKKRKQYQKIILSIGGTQERGEKVLELYSFTKSVVANCVKKCYNE